MRVRARLLLLGIALIGVGCGGAQTTSSAAELRLQREDLVAVSRSLLSLRAAVAREVAAAKRAWPLIADGLPAQTPASALPSVAAAGRAAASISQPQIFDEAHAASLTGPASQFAGQFRTFDGLSTRGWELIGAAIEEIEHGSPTGGRFARDNVALYINSVYDGHFTLAQIGKQLRLAYAKLGGPAAFGSALSQGEVDALSSAYSEAAQRLHPHPGVRLGS